MTLDRLDFLAASDTLLRSGISRRKLLQVGTAAGGGLLLGLSFPLAAGDAEAAAGGFTPNAFIRTDGDGRVILTMPYVEMGLVSVKQYGAVGDGTTDDTAAINAALATGRDVVLSFGTYRVTKTLNMTNPWQKFIGIGGIIQIRSDGQGPDGIGSLAGLNTLEVRGDGCTVQGIRFENPDLLMYRSADSAKNTAIAIFANYVHIIGNTIVSFLHGIIVHPAGEFVGFVASSNCLLEMLGAGAGTNDTRDGLGEDRGDGITAWGAGATISNNFIKLKDGQDGRIGIHTEGLTDQSTVHPKYETRCTTISGNVIWGTYRRGIVTEAVQNTCISGNTIAGPTWWGIAVANVPNVAVTGNSVIFDRLASDNSGGAWGPERAAITIYCNEPSDFNNISSDITVTGNTIDLLGVGHGIQTTGGNQTTRVRNLTISANTIHATAISNVGILIANGDSIVVNANVINGTGGAGILMIDCKGIALTSNAVSSTGVAGIAVQGFNLDVQTAAISSNIVKNCSPGFDIYSVSGVTMIGNTIQSSAGDAIVFNGTNNSIISFNIFKSNAGTVGFANGTGNTIANNITVA